MDKIYTNIGDTIGYLKSQVDIVSVMSDYVRMYEAGKDLYKALCCFHNEHTPSLTVTPSQGLYHCFGCKASGDIINFVRDTQYVNTVEAINILADKYEVDLAPFKRELTLEEQTRVRLTDANYKVASYLHKRLLTEKGKAYEYLVGRGFDNEYLATFMIGYIDGVGTLKGIIDAEDAKILEIGHDKHHMWTDAIVYPLFDSYGKVIGFKTRPFWGGRTTDANGHKLPKYIGTSNNTPLDLKSHIYGLHVARKYIKNGKLILVEGANDVIALHQRGIGNVVGADGTSFGEDRIKILEEFGVKQLIVIFDGDNAGREASLKIANGVADIKTSINIKIGHMDDGYDPNEYMQKYGALAFGKLVDDAIYASQYIVDRIFDGYQLHHATQRIEVLQQIKSAIANIPKLERHVLMSYVAERMKMDIRVVEDVLIADNATRGGMHNVNGEKIVLAEIIRNEDFRSIAMSEIKPHHWHYNRHRAIFEIIQSMLESNRDINIDTLCIDMNNKNLHQLLQGGIAIQELIGVTGDYNSHKQDIIDKAIRRHLIAEVGRFRQDIEDLQTPVASVIEEHFSGINDITDVTNGEIDNPKQNANVFMRELYHKMHNPLQISGLSLGPNWPNTTHILNGLQEKALITVAANQSVGKTTLLCNWLDELSITQGHPWLHFSLEMTREQILNKIIGIRAGVDTRKIQNGNLNSEEYQRVAQAMLDYRNSGLYIDDRATTLEAIISLTRRHIRTKKIVGISIDYIQLMSKERNRSMKRYEELGDISGGLKNDLAKALNTRCIILSQLNRDAASADVAKAEHGAGAYKIAQDSDIYITLKEKSQAEMAQWGVEKGNLVMNIDKNRFGRADVLLDVHFLRDQQRMSEV